MGLASYGSGKHIQKLYEFGHYFPEVAFDMQDPRPYPISSSDKAQLLQYNFEESLTELMLRLDEDYLEQTVCLTGGVFLNINANTKIVQTLKNRKFHITPFVSDCGLSYGAAAFGASLWNDVKVPPDLAFLGKEYVTPKEIKGDNLDLKKVAQYLEDGKIVAWYQGRSEFGPRALGNRSILMSPKYKENKNILNEKVKHREEWRPFAGVILKDYLQDYFEESIESPYMLYSQTVKEDKRDKIPAITHVDNTCRIQTVSEGILSELLEEYHKVSGVPVLLNTSFNDNGKPIIETPENAMDAFLNMNIDYLVINNTIIGK
jgi:carbamoyltransferase